MDDTTVLGSALGQIGLTAKKIGQQVAKAPGRMISDLGEQIGGSNPQEPQQAQKNDWQSDNDRIQFLRDLYGKSDISNDGDPKIANSSEKKLSEFQEQIADKTPEEQKELIQLRNQLHKEEYYDPTFNPVKKQEERSAEKVENEKKMEIQDLQKKEEKKPQPIAVQREQNKAEQFRGAAG